MKIMYFYDHETKEKIDGQEKVVPDEFQITTEKNATLVAPEQGLWAPIKFDEINQKWIGTVEADYRAAHPEPKIEPTADRQLIMVQAQQITMMQQILTTQAADIAKLKQGVDQA